MTVRLDSDLWVRRYTPAPGASVRLVCLPHAGGSAPFFRPVSQALAPAVDVLSVQYPGRQDRRSEPCVETIPELADQVARVLAPLLDLPLALFGHSMGATLAFEVALRLERDHGAPLAWLFASGRRAPSTTREERVHELGDEELLRDVARLRGTDSRLLEDEDVLRMVLPAIRADYRASETYAYRPGPPLACPITAILGDRDPKVTVAEAEAWRGHTTGGFDVRVFPGGHFYLSDHSREVLRVIAERVVPGHPMA
ncbi:surfactin synthase thioesterase subunit [Thermocatellispora tengchongensis]|uniref:Surfactin synthase thioesterase subunit n=1 Tax=Thermocatellispora tengchongensis TaxID=1073253 RepID=A0A840PNA9_9ACTN|nr:alpha/beta fold hydrolase [Thermocatellispora tengchongensis]MBB5137515.1 surfactin synthase thioesterase subunit [Thermocatellispora tengchongensis]